jgi:predicted O-methyltransferase YrrM
MYNYNFSVKWFLDTVTEWKKFLTGEERTKTPLKALEVGSFEGMSAAWMLEHVLTHDDSHITCIDPFTGSEENSSEEKLDLYTL